MVTRGIVELMDIKITESLGHWPNGVLDLVSKLGRIALFWMRCLACCLMRCNSRFEFKCAKKERNSESNPESTPEKTREHTQVCIQRSSTPNTQGNSAQHTQTIQSYTCKDNIKNLLAIGHRRVR